MAQFANTLHTAASIVAETGDRIKVRRNSYPIGQSPDWFTEPQLPWVQRLNTFRAWRRKAGTWLRAVIGFFGEAIYEFILKREAAGERFPSIRSIAECVGCKPSAAKNAIRGLKFLGWLKAFRRYDEGNVAQGIPPEQRTNGYLATVRPDVRPMPDRETRSMADRRHRRDDVEEHDYQQRLLAATKTTDRAAWERHHGSAVNADDLFDRVNAINDAKRKSERFHAGPSDG